MSKLIHSDTFNLKIDHLYSEKPCQRPSSAIYSYSQGSSCETDLDNEAIYVRHMLITHSSCISIETILRVLPCLTFLNTQPVLLGTPPGNVTTPMRVPCLYTDSSKHNLL